MKSISKLLDFDELSELHNCVIDEHVDEVDEEEHGDFGEHHRDLCLGGGQYLEFDDELNDEHDVELNDELDDELDDEHDDELDDEHDDEHDDEFDDELEDDFDLQQYSS